MAPGRGVDAGVSGEPLQVRIDDAVRTQRADRIDEVLEAGAVAPEAAACEYVEDLPFVEAAGVVGRVAPDHERDRGDEASRRRAGIRGAAAAYELVIISRCQSCENWLRTAAAGTR